MTSKFEIIKKKYISLGLKKSQNLYITADFGKIIDKNFLNLKVLENHFQAIREIIGKSGTIIVPTATLNLCNTNRVFDQKSTPSYNMGSFSEMVRGKKGAKRSLHPLWSVSAIGKLSNYFTKNLSKHGFGYNSIWTKLINKNSLSLHIGVDPRKSISIIHYIELMAGVPYRFTKTFNQYIIKNGNKKKEEFFHFCVNNEKKLIRDRNIKIFKNFSKKSRPKKIKFEKGEIVLFSLKDFYEINLEYLTKNPYGWTRKIFK
jgi:aminoglycoside 3-N-acetyltransferase